MLLRLGVGIALIYLGIGRLIGASVAPVTAIQDLIEAAGGIFLLAGLWTPLMGALIALDEAWIALTLYSSQPDNRWVHIFFALLTAGVAMLGPGAWSIDARLFGRKRFKMKTPIRGGKPSL